MSYTLWQLAGMVGGRLKGDGAIVIRAALPISQATPDAITFVADPRKAVSRLVDCKAGAILAPLGFSCGDRAIVEVEDPFSAMMAIAQALAPLPAAPNRTIDPRAAVDPTVRMGVDCTIGPFAVVEAGCVLGDRVVIRPHATIGEECQIGNDTIIHANATLYSGTRVGDRAIIHSGSVIGCDGFGYITKKGRRQKIPQLGVVVIEDDVEIGANASIDRATFGSTSIGAGTKIDNLVQIGHNCVIGRDNVFVAQVGMAGSCVTGDGVVLAGQVGVPDHITIGAGAVLAANAKPISDVPAGQVYLGVPARPEREAKRHHLSLEKVPEMRQQLAEIRVKLGLDAKSIREKGEESAPKRAAG